MTKTFINNLRTVGAASVMVFALTVGMLVQVPSAQAQTPSQATLMQMINDLLAQIALLQAQIEQQSGQSASDTCPYTWTRNLSIGSRGADVQVLQKFLNQLTDTQVVGVAKGQETRYYGSATAAAVSKFQIKHRSAILSPQGLVNPTGVFDASTRAKVNSLCATATNGGEPKELQGEARLIEVEVVGNDESIKMGRQDQALLEMKLQFEDGDAEISRFDIAFDKNGSTPVANYFEDLTLWVDGDKVAMEIVDAVTHKSNTIRISNASVFAADGKEVVIVLGASLNDASSATPMTGDWSVAVQNIRYFDADGVANTDSNTGDLGKKIPFTVVDVAADDSLTVKDSKSNPDAAIILLDEEDESDWYTIFTFELEAGNDDIEIDQIPLNIFTKNVQFNNLVDDVRLRIDGELFDKSAGGGSAGSNKTQITFDIDGDVVVESGDEVIVELEVRFEALESVNEGETIYASVDADDIVAEGMDDLEKNQLFGVVTGETHTLVTDEEAVDAVRATITSISNTENPTVQGTAIGATIVEFGVDNEEEVYVGRDIPVVNGKWSHKISQNLTNGDYNLTLYIGNKEVDSKKFTVGDGEEEVEMPNTNNQSCDRGQRVKRADGKFACYGIWDYGNDFGGDADMCGGYDGDKTGCRVEAPRCESGVAEAMWVKKPSELGPNRMRNAISRLKTSQTAIEEGIARIWSYSCVAADEDESGSAVSVEGKVYAVGVYQGEYPAGEKRGFQQHPQGAVAVNVAVAEKDSVLVLTSYEPVKWNLSGSDLSNISHIFVSGFYEQEVAGNHDAKVTKSSDEAGDKNYYYTYEENNNDYKELDTVIQDTYGESIDTFYGEYDAGSFTVGTEVKGVSTSVSTQDQFKQALGVLELVLLQLKN